MGNVQYAPGSLVKARGREWMIISTPNPDTIRVRPLSGSEEDQTLIFLPLEKEPVTQAKFPDPKEFQIASHEASFLLRDALLLSLRRGAGPFRSFGQIAVEPRAYQLVPLLMALKQDTVRLLIADDVGIGKTIEAGLIARELIDRGEIIRFAVLCPPHLVEQWISELELKFHLRAVPITASSASRLERNLPIGESLFTTHPFTVVSLDYIKAQNRRSEFLRACPEFVIVDEAHACTIGGKGRHQRYELLKELSEDINRHIVLLTATPHSGNEEAFYKTLGLLDAEFETLKDLKDKEREKLREKLSGYFVQRRRPDITEWKEGNLFPKRETLEITYELTGKWKEFLDHVLDYCADIVEAGGSDERKRRLNFWGTLALLRCVSSSPAAAIQALRTRGINYSVSDEYEEVLEDQIFDGDADHLTENDQEPSTTFNDPKINDLINEAKELTGSKGDPKFKLLKAHLTNLIEEGYNPVVFCRYIATAHYLKSQLQDVYKGVAVDFATGEFTSEERKEKVEILGESDQRILIATDCLSEGINLQNSFDSVIHYDLSWNPTRHEQREGRVDRYGQPKSTVRTILLYGSNNPVDGAVLQVIIRKAESIRKELGVPVPLPDENHQLTQALMNAVLIKNRERSRQMTLFDFMEFDEGKAIDTVWKDAAEKAKRNRTIFAQSRLRPTDVLPEWHRSLGSIGNTDDVARFTVRALTRLGATPEKLKKGYKVPLGCLPDFLKERLDQEGISGSTLIDFSLTTSSKFKAITRSHPLVHILADTLLERTLDYYNTPEVNIDPSILGRVGCWISSEVKNKTTIAVLRLRHQLTTQAKNRTHTMLVEEASCIAWEGKEPKKLIDGQEVLKLISTPPTKATPKNLVERNVNEALSALSRLSVQLNSYGEKRAKDLLQDHRRVREASDAKGKYAVKALLPPDVIGIFVLLPSVEQL